MPAPHHSVFTGHMVLLMPNRVKALEAMLWTVVNGRNY